MGDTIMGFVSVMLCCVAFIAGRAVATDQIDTDCASYGKAHTSKYKLECSK